VKNLTSSLKATLSNYTEDQKLIEATIDAVIQRINFEPMRRIDADQMAEIMAGSQQTERFYKSILTENWDPHDLADFSYLYGEKKECLRRVFDAMDDNTFWELLGIVGEEFPADLGAYEDYLVETGEQDYGKESFLGYIFDRRFGKRADYVLRALGMSRDQFWDFVSGKTDYELQWDYDEAFYGFEVYDLNSLDEGQDGEETLTWDNMDAVAEEIAGEAMVCLEESSSDFVDDAARAEGLVNPIDDRYSGGYSDSELEDYVNGDTFHFEYLTE